MILRPIGQSGYVIKTVSTEIIIDPYLSDVVNKVANRPRMVQSPIDPKNIKSNAVICTHNHLDHLDAEACEQMPKETYFITTNEGKVKLSELGQNNAIALNLGDCIAVGDIELTAVYANHTVEAFGLIIKTEGKTLYFSGDTLFDEKLFEISAYKPDYTFICINGKLGNMTVDEAVITAKKIGAKFNVPNHYDMFESNTENPHKFTDNINGGLILKFNEEYEI